MSSTTPQAGNLMSQLGGSALGSIVGEGIGLLFAGANNTNQANQQDRLDQIQLKYNEQMSDYNYANQLKLWQETNYPAQVQELEKAGLNPALLYGSRGGGGATTGTPSGGIGGAQAPSVSPAETAQMAIMSQQAQADINLKNAEAENIRAKTPQEAPLMTAQTQSLTQGVQNMQAQQALTEMQTTAQSIQNKIQGTTDEDQIAQIRSAAQQIQAQAQQAVRNNYIDQNTMDAKIKIVQGQMIGIYLQNQLTKAETGLTTEQIQQVTNGIAQAWQNVKINAQNANTNEGHLMLQRFIQDTPESGQIEAKSRQILYQGLTRLIPNLFFGF